MRRCLLLFSTFIFFVSIVQGQKPVALQAMSLFHGRDARIVALFTPAKEAREDLHEYVDNALSMTLLPGALQQLNTERPTLLRIQLPSPFNINLDLYQVNIFSATARIMTSDGLILPPNPGNVFYRGMISGNPNSLAIVSIVEDKIQILYSDQNGNKRIQPQEDGSYIAFEDKNIQIPRQLDCHVQDVSEDNPVEEPGNSPNRMLTGNCVEVYVECDFQSYLSNGSSVPNTEAWVATLWNEVITLYDNESIPVAVSDVFIYTSTFPAFDTLTTTSAILNAFVNHMGTISYNGRLAHFMSTRGLGGGIAYLDVLCSTTIMCAVSTSLSTNIVPFPTYSWNVEVVTHEMGHNMGSQHTHACAWNGNNTAIDGCGPAAGYSEGCTGPIPASGTIMSYCHLSPNPGINFLNGFGPQPGDRIRNRYNNASCNTGTCSLPICTSLTEPLGGSNNVDINNDLFWTEVPSVNGYFLTVGTTPGGSNILNNFDVGLVTTYDPGVFPYSSSIYVMVVPYNNLGNATGCQEQSFVTEPNIAPTCTHLTDPLNETANVSLTTIIRWAHSVGNQTGYKITIGTTPGGSQIANQLNVGNVNFYDPPGLLPHSSTIYVLITPYGAGGDIQGCSTESFSTLVPMAGDFCSMAMNLPCGASLTGNTSQALADPEAFACGANIMAPGLWYTFVGDGQNAVIATCSQYSYDTQLNAYSGSCSNLICVTGIDDFCAQGSQISFATTNGVTYFIFVQGYGGETGSYTLTRTCYGGPLYCQSSGYYPTSEWINTFSFAGYTKQSGSTSYSDFTNDVITVSRGGSYPVQITPGFLQDPRSEFYRVWIDLNKDGDFSDSGEQLFAPGSSTSSVSGTITLPLSASTGITRMRVSMRYSAAPSTCGTFLNGEVEDYSVNIRCNLVTSTSDSGNGSLRNVSMCADDNENVLFAPALNNQTINVTTGPIVVDGLWKWMPGTGTNITIKASATVTRLLSIPVSKSAEIQNLTLIGGNTSPGSAIDNAGSLILRDCHVKPTSGSGTIPVRNNGVMNIFGMSDIKL